MATWKKIITSGSNAELHHISASGNIVPYQSDGVYTNADGSLGTADEEWSNLYLADSSSHRH